MRRLGGLFALVVLGASPGASLTGWECTTDTLASGDRCIFQGVSTEAGKPKADDNVKAMSALADSICDLHLKSSERTSATDAVNSSCKAEVAQAAREACSTRSALLDDQGRFVPAAKPCYRALTDVRQRAEWQAQTLAPCCACLAEQHCVTAPAKCVASAQVSSGVEAANAKCALASCESACVGLLPEAEADPESPTKSRVSRR